MAKSKLAPALLTGLALVALPFTAWAAAAPRQKGDDYYTKKVCEVITPTGSRLGGTRRCRTQAELDAQRQEDRTVLERVQSMKASICAPTRPC